tara:strand:+ start:193 stop:429 length:237 start_codon:yes stop_codon:yes gene_type:complete
MKLDKKQAHVLLKCAEELSELSAELLKAVNKPNKRKYNKICAEIFDTEDRLLKLKEFLNPEYNYPNYNEELLIYGDIE